jgi:hypothetical protein
VVSIPCLKEHLKRDREVLGKEYPLVHKAKDYPGLLLGKLLPKKYGLEKHRLIGHFDPWFNLVIPPLLYPDDPLRAVASAWLHDSLDMEASEKKRASGAGQAPRERQEPR